MGIALELPEQSNFLANRPSEFTDDIAFDLILQLRTSLFLIQFLNIEKKVKRLFHRYRLTSDGLKLQIIISYRCFTGMSELRLLLFVLL